MKTMTTFLMCLAVTSSVFVCGGHQSCEQWSPPEKIYVLPEHLRLSDKAMFVFLNDVWQKTEALFSDERGVFVFLRPNPKLWYCGKCSAYHNCNENCPKTGRSPPASCDR